MNCHCEEPRSIGATWQSSAGLLRYARNDTSENLQDVRQTNEYASFMGKLGWKIEIFGKTKIFVKKFLFFNIVKILRSSELIDSKKIKNKYQPLKLVIQPFGCKAKPCNSPLVPTKTIWINLAKSEKKLLQDLKQKTRYNLKQAQKNNLKLKIISGDKISPQELQDFFNLWQKNKPFDWFFKPSFFELKSLIESFGQRCFFVLMYPCHPSTTLGMTNSELLASCLILTSDNMAFYWHNCSNKQAKKLFAPTFAVWEAIKESKKRNLKVFDLEGIWDERLPKVNLGWKGFTRFKEGFGGKPINFS